MHAPQTQQLDLDGDSLRSQRLIDLPIDRLRPDPEQPRRYFDADALSELRDSLALYGLLHPIGVRQAADGNWDLVFGERRYRAAIQLGWKTIPARVFPMEVGRFKTVLQLGENSHRADLSLLEYLGGIERLRDLGVTGGAMARMLCKSDAWVAAMLAISRDPLARSLYEAGVMTQVGAWEAFCRLPEHLRAQLLQSGEQLTIQRCKKVLDAHEAQRPARQQGLLKEPTRGAFSSGEASRAHAAPSSAPEETAPAVHDPADSAGQIVANAQDVVITQSGARERSITVALPLWLACALLPERETQLQQIVDLMPGTDGVPDAVRAALTMVEQELIQVISGFGGGRP